MVEIVGLVLDRQVPLYGSLRGRGRAGWRGGGGIEKGCFVGFFYFVFLQFCRCGDCRFAGGQTSPHARRKAGWRDGRKGG